MKSGFSDYIVYVDESGDHSLTAINKTFPIFVLAFCIFEKKAYCEAVAPAVQAFKFRHFGHDMAVLHEREIRKATPPFNILLNQQRREAFHRDLNHLIEQTPFTVIAAIIRKSKLHSSDVNPYDMAMKSCLERLYQFLGRLDQHEKTTHLVFEKRGKREDAELELEFLRVCKAANTHSIDYPFQSVFASKQSNSAGLQLADMVARPIGVHELKPNQPNRAYSIIEGKFYRGNCGGIQDAGLACFPQKKQ